MLVSTCSVATPQLSKSSHHQASSHPPLLKKTQSFFFQAILEGMADGILVVTEQGERVHANSYAHHLCQKLSQHSSSPHSVPQAIWQSCQALINSRTLFPDHQLVIESEINLERLTNLRLRVSWFELAKSDRPYILVILEEYPSLAHTEAKRYNLTPREAEIWSLRCQGLSYKDIAARLYISLNTVKKHLKNVNSKRQASL